MPSDQKKIGDCSKGKKLFISYVLMMKDDSRDGGGRDDPVTFREKPKVRGRKSSRKRKRLENQGEAAIPRRSREVCRLTGR